MGQDHPRGSSLTYDAWHRDLVTVGRIFTNGLVGSGGADMGWWLRNSREKVFTPTCPQPCWRNTHSLCPLHFWHGWMLSTIYSTRACTHTYMERAEHIAPQNQRITCWKPLDTKSPAYYTGKQYRLQDSLWKLTLFDSWVCPRIMKAPTILLPFVWPMVLELDLDVLCIHSITSPSGDLVG